MQRLESYNALINILDRFLFLILDLFFTFPIDFHRGFLENDFVLNLRKMRRVVLYVISHNITSSNYPFL